MEDSSEPMVVDPPASDTPDMPDLVGTSSTSSEGIKDDLDTDIGDDSEAGGSVSAEQKLIKAVGFKDRGNEAIKEANFADAKRMYERGLKIVDNLRGIDQAEGLKVSLGLNLALACTKLSHYAEAIKAADAVIALQPNNVKALFRRGVARASFGLLDGAKNDLSEVVKADPKNAAARKELKAVKESIAEQKKLEKASYSGLFAKAGSMYNDKEQERQIKAQQEAVRLQQEEDAWNESNGDRVAVGLGAQTKEEWLKEKADKAAKEKARQDAERAAHSSKSTASSTIPPNVPPAGVNSSSNSSSSGAAMDVDSDSAVNAANGSSNKKTVTSAAAAGSGSTSDDDHLDEEDRKIMNETKKQGYCYFRRKLDAAEQALLDEEQAKLRNANLNQSPSAHSGGITRTSSTASSNSNSNAAAAGAHGDSGSMLVSPTDSMRKSLASPQNTAVKSGSEWNTGGTWEETDKSEWVKSRLEAHLKTVSVQTGPDLAANPQLLMQEITAAIGTTEATNGSSSTAAPAVPNVEAIASLGAKLATATATVYKVEHIEGDASIITSRGKRRYIFDYSITLKWRIEVDDSMGVSPSEGAQAREPKVYKGSYKLVDVTSADVDKGLFETEPELTYGKTRWPAVYNDRMNSILQSMKADAMKKLQLFYAEYQSLP